jgi:alanine racemase
MTSRRSFLASAAAALLVSRPRALLARITQGAPQSFSPWLEIDAAALQHNARAVARLSEGKPLIAVVKNNAYGLGLAQTGPLFDAMNEVRMLAVVRPEEALALRDAGVQKPILLMGPANEEELMRLVPLDVVQSPYRAEAPVLLGRVGTRLGRPVRVHLYVDTGMHRMGMPVAQAMPWVESLAKAGVRIEGAFTELTEDPEFDRSQAALLRSLQMSSRASGVELGLLHAASSDAVMHQTSGTYLDAVRPGLALYGGYVSERAMQRGELRPAYRLKARVIRLDQLKAGDGVSYHRRWTTDKPIWTATLGIGHVDGYPSGAVKGCEVLIGGRLYPVIGTVSASHTIVALGEERVVNVGAEATLVGPDHPELHPNEVAKRSGWSEYNMFMHLNPALPKRVVS